MARSAVLQRRGPLAHGVVLTGHRLGVVAHAESEHFVRGATSLTRDRRK